ncbi:MAG: hypothetical protein WCP55_15995 [Lentisphaerota bacterium]
MNTITTNFSRDHYKKYKGETIAKMMGKRSLRINTSVNDGRSFSMALFQDFSITIKQVRIARSSTKIIEAQHNAVNIAEILEQAERFYA